MSVQAQHHGPTRTCVGCGRRDAQSSLLRLRRDGAGAIAAAQAGAPGRSAYVHRHPECVGGLARSKGLGKSLRATVTKEARLELMQALQAGFSLPPAPPAGRQVRADVGTTKRASGTTDATQRRDERLTRANDPNNATNARK